MYPVPFLALAYLKKQPSAINTGPLLHFLDIYYHMETTINFLSDMQNVVLVTVVMAGIGCVIIFAPAFFKRSAKWNS